MSERRSTSQTARQQNVPFKKVKLGGRVGVSINAYRDNLQVDNYQHLLEVDVTVMKHDD